MRLLFVLKEEHMSLSYSSLYSDLNKAGQKIWLFKKNSNTLDMFTKTKHVYLFYVECVSSSACKQGAAHPGSTSERRLLRQQHHTHALWYSHEHAVETDTEENTIYI